MTFSKIYTGWHQTDTIPFNELILSWNGVRPQKSTWTFWVSLDEGEWLKFAEWGPESQRTFKTVGTSARTSQDVVIPKQHATSFRIKVEGEELENLHQLNVCLSNLDQFAIVPPPDLPSVLLKDTPRQSQMVLNHPRHKDLCSPTATCTAVNTLLKTHKLKPDLFADRIRDMEFDIYGNWILNIAEAYHQSRVPCRVERLADFCHLHHHLTQGKPVVVSVKGTIPGAPKPYDAGHLMCVVGYDRGKVYCIDSSFPDDESTFVAYHLTDFLTAWGIRRNLAYTFL